MYSFRNSFRSFFSLPEICCEDSILKILTWFQKRLQEILQRSLQFYFQRSAEISKAGDTEISWGFSSSITLEIWPKFTLWITLIIRSHFGLRLQVFLYNYFNIFSTDLRRRLLVLVSYFFSEIQPQIRILSEFMQKLNRGLLQEFFCKSLNVLFF